MESQKEIRRHLESKGYNVSFKGDVVIYRKDNLSYHKVNVKDTTKVFNVKEYPIFLISFYEQKFKEEIRLWEIRKRRIEILKKIDDE